MERVHGKTDSLYHRVMLFGAFLLFGIAASLTQIMAGVFGEPITASMTELNISGFTIGAFSVCATIFALVAVLATPLCGVLMSSSINMRYVISVCALAHGLAIIAHAFADTMIAFYILSAVRAVFWPVLNLAPAIIITNWFDDRKGVAMGVMLTGSGVIGTILTPIIAGIIVTYGWQIGYIVLGMISIVGLVPFMFIFLRMYPSEKNLKPYLNPSTTVEHRPAEVITDIPAKATIPQSAESNKIDLASCTTIMLSFFCLGFLWMGAHANTVPYLVDIGYDYTTATTILTVCSFSMIFTKPFFGYVFDRVKISTATISCSIISVITIFFLLAATVSPVFAVLYGILLAAFSATLNLSLSVGIQRLFPNQDFNRLYIRSIMIMQLGNAVGIPFAGMMFDYTASYTIPWLIFLGISMLSVVLMFLSNRQTSR